MKWQFTCGFMMLAVQALVSVPQFTLGTTIPAAQFSGNINLFGATQVQTFHEGTISYDYQEGSLQYVASVQLTGGNQLTVDIHGDGRNVGGAKAGVHGSLRYFFAVTKKDPAAPDSPVPFLIAANAHASAHKHSTAAYSPFARSWVSYKHPYATNYEILLTATAETGGDSSVSVDRTFQGLRAQPPGTVGTIAVVAEASARDISATEWRGGSFQAIADPYIRIDPTFTVMVDGVSRLATDVYGIEFSEGIGSGIPEPATVWLLGLTGLILVLPRSGERSDRSTTILKFTWRIGGEK